MNAKIRKATSASNRFVFNRRRGDYLHVNPKLRLGVLLMGLCVTNLEGSHRQSRKGGPASGSYRYNTRDCMYGLRGKTPGVNVKVRKRGLLAMDLCSVGVEGTTIT